MVYWGASTGSAQASESNGPAVFDTAAGFQGVWHMNQAAQATARDATFNGYDGTPSDTSPMPVAGAIGTAQRFNGVSACIAMRGTAAGRLDFPQNGTYTVSAWALADSLDNTYHVIASKQLYQYTLQVRGDNRWEFHEFNDAGRFESTNDQAVIGVWTHLVGVRNGSRQYLYINGELADSVVKFADTNTVRVTTDDLFIGRLPAFDGYGRTWRFFNGMIDEVGIANVARSPDWIRLSYMNQKAGNTLVEFK
jgi:hypothetical protein